MTIVQDISKLFRLRYLRDIILRPTIDEMGVGVINNNIQGIMADLCVAFLSDIEYIARVLHVVNPSVDIKPFLKSDQGAYLLTHLLTHSLTHSLLLTHSLTYSFMQDQLFLLTRLVHPVGTTDYNF